MHYSSLGGKENIVISSSKKFDELEFEGFQRNGEVLEIQRAFID